MRDYDGNAIQYSWFYIKFTIVDHAMFDEIGINVATRRKDWLQLFLKPINGKTMHSFTYPFVNLDVIVSLH